VRLNLDLGELPDEPEALVSLAHMVNVACGAHAGDAVIAARALRGALAHGAQAGAHPSFPDRENFGRTALELDDTALRATLDAQLAWLRSVASSVGAPLAHVKPHGALYHAADRDERVARTIIDASRAALGEVALVGPPDGAMESCARASGVAFLREGFADRGYDGAGALIPRGSPGALLHDGAAVRAQVARLLASGRFDTLCVHGDGPDAVRIASVVREALG
jgi:UPF0271 protein